MLGQPKTETSGKWEEEYDFWAPVSTSCCQVAVLAPLRGQRCTVGWPRLRKMTTIMFLALLEVLEIY